MNGDGAGRYSLLSCEQNFIHIFTVWEVNVKKPKSCGQVLRWVWMNWNLSGIDKIGVEKRVEKMVWRIGRGQRRGCERNCERRNSNILM